MADLLHAGDPREHQPRSVPQALSARLPPTGPRRRRRGSGWDGVAARPPRPRPASKVAAMDRAGDPPPPSLSLRRLDQIFRPGRWPRTTISTDDSGNFNTAGRRRPALPGARRQRLTDVAPSDQLHQNHVLMQGDIIPAKGAQSNCIFLPRRQKCM